MIRMTARAADGIRDILDTNQTPGDKAVKLVPNERGGVSMTIDRAGRGDAVIDRDERPLLIVDASISRQLDGIVLDVTGGRDGEEPEFVFRQGSEGEPGER
jgi:hypothetical protein